MGTYDNGNGNGPIGGQVAACLSSDEPFEQDKLKQAEHDARQKIHYANWKARHERVNGSLPNDIHAEVRKRAEEHGRRVWQQIWAESQAYVNGTIVLTGKMEEQQLQLLAELRRIGNNINQLAKLGHIQARKHGGLEPVGHDAIGTEALRQFSRLEKLLEQFDENARLIVSVEEVSNDEGGQP